MYQSWQARIYLEMTSTKWTSPGDAIPARCGVLQLSAGPKYFIFLITYLCRRIYSYHFVGSGSYMTRHARDRGRRSPMKRGSTCHLHLSLADRYLHQYNMVHVDQMEQHHKDRYGAPHVARRFFVQVNCITELRLPASGTGTA